MKRHWIGLLSAAFFVMSLSGCGSDQKIVTFSTQDESPEAASQMKATAAVNTAAQKQSAVVEKVQAHADSLRSLNAGTFKTFNIYSDENAPDNHYYPSGWMGDYSDLAFDSAHLKNPHAGTTCIRISYTTDKSQGAGWAGVYWQNPANNWGNRPGGYDLSGAKKLTFWVRGEKGGERIEEFKMGGIRGDYSDSDVAGIGPVLLTPEWKQYEIDLEGRDLSSIVGGFAWATNLDNNPDGVVFYLDDIRFE
ncbi:MAG: hypothetical protein HQL11_05105 [Candidatus Omnitrophica bacterium]|nr:hypothetical protein [Candidatus Omnitrophota bacterium]